MAKKKVLGWYFAAADERLRHGDGRKIKVGITHKFKGTPALCERGLHASKRPIDALGYAPGPVLFRVQLGGAIVTGDDKMVATERTYTARVDLELPLREFARWCASQMLHLWDAPQVVKDWLRTGDENLRGAAFDAAESAAESAAENTAGSTAWNIAWSAAWSTAWSATKNTTWSAAGSAARCAAWSAAGSAGKAGVPAVRPIAAESAAWSAAWSKQNKKLLAIIRKHMKKGVK
jgi:hypothetical protein